MSTAPYRLPKSRPQLTGLAWVLLSHGLLFWALHTGLGRTVAEKLPTVVQALLLTDTRPATPAPAAAPPKTPTPPPPAQPAPKTTPPPVPTVVPTPAMDLPVAAATSPALGLTAAPSSTPSAPPATAPALASTPAPVAAAPSRSPAPARTAAAVNINQCEKPEYPSASRRLEEEGTVALRFLVGVDGKVIQSEVEKSSGFKRLDEAARAGLSKCQFRPALVDGKPEQAWASIKYTWRLE